MVLLAIDSQCEQVYRGRGSALSTHSTKLTQMATTCHLNLFTTIYCYCIMFLVRGIVCNHRLWCFSARRTLYLCVCGVRKRQFSVIYEVNLKKIELNTNLGYSHSRLLSCPLHALLFTLCREATFCHPFKLCYFPK